MADVAEFTILIEGDAPTYTVRATGPGDIRSQVTPLILPDAPLWHETLRAIAAQEPLSEAALCHTGSQLFEALFSRSVAHAFYRSAQAHPPTTPLRMRLDIRSPELAVLPWESLYHVDEGYYFALRRDTPLVRTLATLQPTHPVRLTGPLQLLHAASNPVEYGNLGDTPPPLPAEIHTQLNVVPLPAATAESLRLALLHQPFHVLHFDGHGYLDPDTGTGILVVEGSDRHAVPLNAAQLAGMLSGTAVRLVVLAACYSGATQPVGKGGAAPVGVAQQLFRSTAIPAVVGMQYAISHIAAAAFTTGLYQALATGQTIEAAMTDGRLAMQAAGDNSAVFAPVLFLRSGSGQLFESSAIPPSPTAHTSYVGVNVGDGALAQGPGAIAVGKGGTIIQGDVQGDIRIGAWEDT